ncbi:MAG: ribonuclease III, partial [Deltaproteobacteria bacterium]|nr:ribonuclease III [Deltaproteobacteria bacterium]
MDDYDLFMEETIKPALFLIIGPEQEAAIQALESRLGYEFTDRSRLLTALCHRSYIHQFRDSMDVVEDNQRLEFLGDTVLSLCISTALYFRFPQGKEGELSKMRAGLINETTLADLSRAIDLDKALLLG